MQDLLYRFFHNRLAVFGSALLLVFVILALFAPLLAPFSPYYMDTNAILQAPGDVHLLGTDNLGRDILSRIIYGSRISLRVAFTSVTFATICGVLLGISAGFFGGLIDHLLSRVTDVMFSFPEILLALLIMSILGSNINNIIIAISIVYSPIFARIARGAALNIKNSLFIEASRSIGVPNRALLLKHILPNIMPPVIVQITLSLAFAILAEAALSFLGIGAEPDTPSWGIMLSDGYAWLELGWWVSVFPGIAISLAVLAFNVLGDSLRDLLDPKLKNVG